MTVHFPVPFWPAASSILSTSGEPLIVLPGEDVGRDLDEIGIEHAALPVGEDAGDLARVHSHPVPHEVIGLADELHVAVLDAVVHHLDVVAGSRSPRPSDSTARRSTLALMA